jgi:hypothetical protein
MVSAFLRATRSKESACAVIMGLVIVPLLFLVGTRSISAMTPEFGLGLLLGSIHLLVLLSLCKR